MKVLTVPGAVLNPDQADAGHTPAVYTNYMLSSPITSW